MINVGTMTQLATAATSIGQRTLYYDEPGTGLFYILINGIGLWVVSAKYASNWIAVRQAHVNFDPFRLAVTNPFFRGFPTDPINPALVELYGPLPGQDFATPDFFPVLDFNVTDFKMADFTGPGDFSTAQAGAPIP